MIAVILAALAGHRAGRAVSVDAITDDVRKRIQDWSIMVDLTDKQLKRRGYVYSLVKCPHCTGFWLTGIAWLVFKPAGLSRLRGLALWWAAAGIQSTMASFQMAQDKQVDLAEAQTKIANAQVVAAAAARMEARTNRDEAEADAAAAV